MKNILKIAEDILKIAGVWAIPTVKNQVKLEKIVRDLKDGKLDGDPQKVLYDILGDDLLMDNFDKEKQKYQKEVYKIVKNYLVKFIEQTEKNNEKNFRGNYYINSEEVNVDYLKIISKI
jgi:hypothetical protein